MKAFEINDLKSMASQNGTHCLTVYFPTVKAGPETRQNPLQLKNSLREAHQKLLEVGMVPRRLLEFLEPVAALVEDSRFWQQQEEGLALFRYDDALGYLRIPYPVDRMTVVANAPFLKPLLPFLTKASHWHILVPNQHAVRVFSCTPWKVREINVPDLPSNIQDALGPEEYIPSPQHHTAEPSSGAAGHAAVHHGHRDPKESAKDRSLRFYRRINEVLCPFMNHHQDPLFVATTPEQFALFQMANHYPKLAEECLHSDPHNVKPEELHRASAEIMQNQRDRRRREVADQIEAALAKGKATTRLEELATAAVQGRVAACIVNLREDPAWGVYSHDRAGIEILDSTRHCARDLVDMGAVETWRHGGEVFPVEDRQLVPGHNAGAALLRH